MLRLTSLLFGLALLAACSKDKSEPTIDFGPDGGFQYRTPINSYNGGDATDWTDDGKWNTREKQLFASLNLSLDNAAPQTHPWDASVFPNPEPAGNDRTFFLMVNPTQPPPTGSRAAYVIVDAHYQVLQRDDLAAEKTKMVAIAPNSLPAGALYRLYYVCYVPGQQVYYRSHGDIKVE